MCTEPFFHLIHRLLQSAVKRKELQPMPGDYLIGTGEASRLRENYIVSPAVFPTQSCNRATWGKGAGVQNQGSRPGRLIGGAGLQ